ncbi:hypothetical protein [Hydrogenophaga sp.]|uniref:hypothetical protein n=1 Tax=Hydrogenophaga sp. TaxID=1904254 RepID=UPI003565D36D
MNEQRNPDQTAPVLVPSADTAGVSRRRLMRAGLATAPVMAALKSNTVLAGGGHSCIRPSSFSSLTAAQMKLSAGRVVKSNYKCESHGYWVNHDNGLPRNFKTTTKFLSSTTGFSQNPNGAFSGLTLQQVLEQGGNQSNAALARHVAAAYLSALSVNNVSSMVWLTKQQCQAIWNGQGVWTPFAGTTWNLSQTMAYFEKIYGPAFL